MITPHEETTRYEGRRNEEEMATSGEERKTTEKGKSRPRLIDVVTLIGLGYVLRDWFGSVSEKVSSEGDGSANRGHGVIDTVKSRTWGRSHGTADQVQQRSQKVAEKTEGTTENIANRIRESSEEVSDQIEEGSKQIGKMVEQKGEKASEVVEESGEKASEVVEERGGKASEVVEERGEKAGETLRDDDEETSGMAGGGNDDEETSGMAGGGNDDEETSGMVGEGDEEDDDGDTRRKMRDGGNEIVEMTDEEAIVERIRRILSK